MASALRNVIIVGASGNAGPPVVDAFLKAPSFNVSVLTRAESSATFPSSVKVFKTDYTEASLLSAFKGQDAVVSILAFRALVEQKKLIDVAIKAGVRHFIPSEYGPSPYNTRNQDIMPTTFKIKGETLEYLKKKENLGLSWTAIATGLFFDWGLKVGFLGFDLKKYEAVIWDDGEARWSTTTLPTVGSAIVAALQKPELTANKVIHVASFTVSQNDVVHALEEATGVQWRLVRKTSAEEIATGTQKLRDGDLAGAIPRLVHAQWYTKCRGGNYAEEFGLENVSLGLPKEDLLSVIRDIVQTSKVS